MTVTCWKSPASQTSADLTRRLHLLIRAGKGEEAEADEIREQASALWPQLTKDEQRRIRRLSAELAMLYDKEVPRPKVKLSPELERLNKLRRARHRPKTSAEERQKNLTDKIREWHQWDDWEPILEALREDPQLWDAPRVAAYRGRAYHYWGDYETSLVFFRFALEREPAFLPNRTMLMQLLGDMDLIEEQSALAEEILSDPQSPPLLALMACLSLARPQPPNDEFPTGVVQRMLDISNAVLANPGKLLPKIAKSTALTTMGIAFENLGDADKALGCFVEALQVDGNNATAALGAGKLSYAAKPEIAVRYFARCAQLAPTLLWPHMYLAHFNLVKGEPGVTVAEANLALQYAVHDRQKAILLMWRAIGLLQSGGEVARARADFVEAMKLGSDIPSISANYLIFRQFADEYQRSNSSIPPLFLQSALGEPLAFPSDAIRPAEMMADTQRLISSGSALQM